MSDISKCPALGGGEQHNAIGSNANQHWWPNQLNLKVLNQNNPQSSPMNSEFNYVEEFNSLDLNQLKTDIGEVMTTSQDWWPADYGHYGPLFIRMAWHSAGTYRIGDGRGGAGSGTLRFAPLNSWPDNANLDKARMLLWPVKKKYGRKISWADLMVLTGNCALESMGFKTFGFSGGRQDVFEPAEDIYWGSETEWLGDERYSGERELEGHLGAVQMGLIYVNPEGPNGNPNPVAAAKDIRETFGRMAMNDEETVALIAGGHTFGKAHGAADPTDHVGPEPEGAAVEVQGMGWMNSYGSGNAADTITSGLEGAWTTNPVQWDNNYFENLFEYEWKQSKSPAGATQWVPTSADAEGTVPDAHDPSKRHAPVMFTTDLALREDSAYAPISKRFHENPDQFADAFARAWYKLTHRDMGPISRCFGPEVPAEAQIWQDPVPTVDHELVNNDDIAALKSSLVASGLSVAQMVSTAWASASTFRGTDKRGGANGGRIRLAPQKYWESNNPTQLADVLQSLETVQSDFNNAQTGGKKISMADLIVLAGCAGVEKAASDAGHAINVPFTPGRTDATAEQTDVESFAVLEPNADGFRNYYTAANTRKSEELLVEKAQMLNVSAPEMTVLVGGLRVMNSNVGETDFGVFTDRPGQLTNDFFVHLLDLGTRWQVSDKCDHLYEGLDRSSGEQKWRGSAVDLIFGSNSQLRAIAEVYASDDSEAIFLNDFVSAWNKVMNADRFDLA